jgi:hypothetical protein
MREFREYLASSYEPQGKIAARVGVTQSTISDWLLFQDPSRFWI